MALTMQTDLLLECARGIGPALWRDPSTLALGEGHAEQGELPHGMFQLAACDPAPH